MVEMTLNGYGVALLAVVVAGSVATLLVTPYWIVASQQRSRLWSIVDEIDRAVHTNPALASSETVRTLRRRADALIGATGLLTARQVVWSARHLPASAGTTDLWKMDAKGLSESEKLWVDRLDSDIQLATFKIIALGSWSGLFLVVPLFVAFLASALFSSGWAALRRSHSLSDKAVVYYAKEFQESTRRILAAS